MKPFIIKSALLTLAVLILGGVLYATVFKVFYLQVLPFLLVFFFGVTNLVHAYLLKSAGKSGAKFTAQFMAASFIKMFFYIVVAVVYVILERENARVFIINYLLLYVVYTIFEISELRKVVKQVN